MKTRREFLQQGSAATAGLLVSSQVARSSRLVNAMPQTPQNVPQGAMPSPGYLRHDRE